jgi:histone deacetylase 6
MVVETIERSCEGSKRRHVNGGDIAVPCSGEECSNGDINVAPGVSAKRARVSREMTFEDIYGADALLNDDDDEDDDCDWEPVQAPMEFVKWCCVNCTMSNPGDMVHCCICGEHKESGILRHGYLASPFFKDTGLIEVEEKYGGSSSATSSTAVGFDERMLLHSEV